MILRQTIWGPLEKIIRLGFRKGWVIPEWFAILLIKQKNHKKRFGEFEFQLFGDSDVVNKLFSRNWSYQTTSNQRILFLLTYKGKFTYSHKKKKKNTRKTKDCIVNSNCVKIVNNFHPSAKNALCFGPIQIRFDFQSKNVFGLSWSDYNCNSRFKSSNHRLRNEINHKSYDKKVNSLEPLHTVILPEWILKKSVLSSFAFQSF